MSKDLLDIATAAPDGKIKSKDVWAVLSNGVVFGKLKSIGQILASVINKLDRDARWERLTR